MAQNDAATDARTDRMKTEMAAHFADEVADYRAADHCEIVYEGEEAAVVADHAGHEINEWASEFGVDRSELSATMHDLAEQLMGRQDAHEHFSYSDPVVFDRLED